MYFRQVMGKATHRRTCLEWLIQCCMSFIDQVDGLTLIVSQRFLRKALNNLGPTEVKISSLNVAYQFFLIILKMQYLWPSQGQWLATVLLWWKHKHQAPVPLRSFWCIKRRTVTSAFMVSNYSRTGVPHTVIQVYLQQGFCYFLDEALI